MPDIIPDRLRGLSVEQLRYERSQLDEQLRTLHADDSGVPRHLSQTDQSRFDGLMYDREVCNRLVEEHEIIARAYARGGSGSVERAFSVSVDNKINPYDGQNVLRMADEQVRSQALRALEMKYGTEHLRSDQVDQLDRLVRADEPDLDGSYIARRILLTENSAYRSAWARLMVERTPLLTNEETQAVRDFQSFERHETRAMSEGTTTAGGFGVPVFIDPTLVLTGGESGNPFMEMARQVNVTTNVWKGVNTAGVSWSFDTEGTEVSDDSPVLAQPTATVFTARGWVPYSIEVGQDYPGLAMELSSILAAGYIDLEINKLTNGNGTTEPKGIITYLSANAAVRVKVATPGAFVVGDLYAAWTALPIRFRARASWLSSTDIQNKVRNFGATFGANFTEDLTRGPLQNLFGVPYRLTDYMAASTTFTTANIPLSVVGDWSNFVIARRAGLNVEPVPVLMGSTNQRPTGSRGVFAWARFGAATATDTAFRMLTNVT
jgi:HK97 family phage major capsid protein